jgi:hypothetical protein
LHSTILQVCLSPHGDRPATMWAIFTMVRMRLKRVPPGSPFLKALKKSLKAR